MPTASFEVAAPVLVQKDMITPICIATKCSSVFLGYIWTSKSNSSYEQLLLDFELCGCDSLPVLRHVKGTSNQMLNLKYSFRNIIQSSVGI